MTASPTRPALLAALAAGLLLGCGGDNGVSPPGPPAGLDIAAGNNQTGTVGAPVPTAPQVRLRDAAGRGIAGVSVRFDVVGGGGSVSGDSVVTDANGVATVGQWRLGPVPGENSLRAQALGYPLLTTFSATSWPGAPSSIQIVQGGAGLTAIVSQEVLPRPSVRIRDAFGNPIPGVEITWTVVEGAGTVIGGPTTTDAEGRTTVGGWILGPEQGVNQLRARTPNGIIATVTATSIGIPSALEPVVPTVQQGFASFPVPLTARVRVKDAQGGDVVGIPVVFRLVGGGGVIKGDTVATGADGVAALGDWRLDATGSSMVEAFVPGFPGPVVTFEANGTVSPFTIDLRFIGTPQADLRDDFVRAAMRWMQVIIADLPNFTLFTGNDPCGNGQSQPVNELVDDVVIIANITPIDGPGRVLGSAFSQPNWRRTPTQITALGCMTFDVEDALIYHQTDRFYTIALHEMGHVLGLGTVWNARGFNSDFCGPDATYTAPQAVAQWPSLGITFAGTPIPIENQGSCNGGTRDVHWRESVLGSEVMTGFVEAAGVEMPLTGITIGALADLGYTVDLGQAEPFSSSLTAGGAPASERLVEILRPVKWVENSDGTKRPVDM